MKKIGIILVLIGILTMAYTGFTYVTTEKVVDISTIEINKEKENPVQWPSIAGGILLVGGVILIFTDKDGK